MAMHFCNSFFQNVSSNFFFFNGMYFPYCVFCSERSLQLEIPVEKFVAYTV